MSPSSSASVVAAAEASAKCDAERILTDLSPDRERDVACIKPNDAVEIALAWHDAVRRGDTSRLSVLVAIPSSIRGFNIDSGPEAAACGAKPRADGLVGVRTFDGASGIQRVVSDQHELADALRCLLLDKMLVEYIPIETAGAWPEHRKDPKDRVVGSLRIVRREQIAPALATFGSELSERAGTHIFVQARMTDDNGVTNHVLLTVPTDHPVRIDGVYIHELFEC